MSFFNIRIPIPSVMMVLCFVLSFEFVGICQEEEEDFDPEMDEFIAEAEDFLRRNAKSLHIFLINLAEENEEAAIEKGLDTVRRFEVMEERFGWDVAHLYLQVKNTQAKAAMAMVKMNRGEIDEDRGKDVIEKHINQVIQLNSELDKAKIDYFKERVEELQEAIDFRSEEPREAIMDTLEKVEFEFFEFEEEFEEEWEEEEDYRQVEEYDGPIYTPAPGEKNSEDLSLKNVSYTFPRDIIPVIEEYCLDCHDREIAKGDVDIESIIDQKPYVKNLQLWINIAERIRNGDMPPEEKPQLPATAKNKLRAWIHNDILNFNYDQIKNPGFTTTRRLSRAEFNNTVRDLFGVDLKPANNFPMDFTGTSGFSNSANTLYIQSANLERYISSADWIIETIQKKHKKVWNEIARIKTPKDSIQEFMFKAFRRPPNSTELQQVYRVFQQQIEKGAEPSDALAKVYKTILISPMFLLRGETPPKNEGVKDQPILNYDLASRLSYFLWGSVPDNELFSSASRGELHKPENIKRQVDRMLNDPKSLSIGYTFAQEWLGIDDIGPRIRKDPIDNPWCTETLMESMRNETSFFLHSLIQDNAPVSELLTADYTFLNEELAHFYRIGGIKGEEMRRVSIRGNSRGGLLGQASVLAVTSYPDRTSPVLRGTWILNTLLGTPPPPPPPNVPDLEDVDFDREDRPRNRSLRARLEFHRNSPNCAGCHSKIDPLGFALENFAEFGQQRRGRDTAGALPNGATFYGLAGLKLALVDNNLDELGKQVIRKMLSYALGRQLEYYDEGTVNALAKKTKPNGYRLKDIVSEIATSYPFTTKRVPQE